MATTAPPSVTGLPLIEHTLDNGLRVVISEDHLAPLAAVNVWYDVGSRHEQPGRTGFAHLFEHLMFQGSRNVAASQHFALLQDVGATLNGTTSFDRTNYFETVPRHAFELALWLEADRMGSLLEAVTQENLDNQRDVVKNERRQRYDNVPYGTAWERLFSLLFPEGHPYHHMPIGSMADLDAAALDDVHAFFGRHYGPNNAVLSLVGDVDPAAAIEAVERYFGGIGPTATAPGGAPDGTIAVAGDETRQLVGEAVPNEALFQAYRAPAGGTAPGDALTAAMEILTGGDASRLVRRLVREEELAQAVSGGTQGLVGGTDVAALIVHARSGASLEAIDTMVDDELGRLAEDGPSDDELARAQARLERRWLSATNTAMGRADNLSRFATLFGDPTLIDGVIPRVQAVTAEAVRDAAAERLTPTNRAVVEYRLEGAASAVEAVAA